MSNDEEFSPIDVNAGINQVGETGMFLSMMENFERLTLTKNLMALKMAIDSNNWDQVKDESHSLKGASSYLCTFKLTELAKQLQLAVENKEYNQVYVIYPKLV